MTLIKSLTRIFAFVGKELVTTVRQPGAIFSLVLGPFLIMALFGYGYNGFRKPLDTLVVVPQSAGLPRDPSFYADLGGAPLHVIAVIDDADAAKQQLALRQVDLVVIAPPDAGAKFQAGQQEVITVAYNEVDPVAQSYVTVLADEVAARVNRELIAQAVKTGEQYAIGIGKAARVIPPDVLAAPTKVETENLAPTTPNVVDFFAPAVLALILQHMAVTLTALSLVRERFGGAIELFRITPTSAAEILAGKYVAFGILNLVVAGAVIALMVTVLHVPFLASLPFVLFIVVLLSFASLGLGLLISALADSERSAVQISLLALLASVFLSGFAVPLRDFDPAVRNLAYALPVTHGLRLLQDAFLRGTFTPANLLALGLIGIVLLVATNLVLTRSMRPV